MRGLLDVNVLVALLNQHNANHFMSNEWLDANAAEG